MTLAYKTLGQQAPAAATPADLYTVPGGAQAIVEGITITNRSATAAVVRLSVSVGGGATADKDYLLFDTELNGNAVINVNAVITVAATDVVRVQSDSGLVSFNAFGVEIT